MTTIYANPTFRQELRGLDQMFAQIHPTNHHVPLVSFMVRFVNLQD